MRLLNHQRLIEKAGEVLELIEYAEKRIKHQRENDALPVVFTNLHDRNRRNMVITKRAKERIEKYYRNLLEKIIHLNSRELENNSERDIQTSNRITTQDLDTTQRVLRITAEKIRAEESKEYHLCKREGKGIQFENLQTLRENGSKIKAVAKLVNYVYED